MNVNALNVHGEGLGEGKPSVRKSIQKKVENGWI